MKTLYLLDASGFVYRSYFAIRNMTNAKGESTNALFGFIRSVLKLKKDFHPTHMAAVFDGPHNAKKREAIYSDYKAHRAEMPGDLLYQIHWAQNFCNLMGIPMLAIPEVEADDTLGSIAQWAAAQGAAVFICSSDKDLCQLVTPNIYILNTFKENAVMGPKEVEEAFGVPPDKMVDYLAITGDSSDNVPGITGFGPKTAAALIKEFGSLENLLSHPQLIGNKKKEEALLAGADNARLSKKLVIIDTQVPFPQDVNFFENKPPQFAKLKEFYNEMKFNSLIKELEETAVPEVGRRAEPSEKVEYLLVDDEEAFRQLIEYLSSQRLICFDVETTDIRPLQAELVGIGFGVHPSQAWYVPVNGKLGLTKVLEGISPLFANPNIGFYGHNVKYDYHVLANHGIKVETIAFDTILASYLLNSQSRQHNLDTLSLELFGKVKIPISSLIGKGKKEISMRDVPLPQVSEYCCEDVDYTCRLKGILEPDLSSRGLRPLLDTIELPLVKVLADMERRGIYLDKDCLMHFGSDVNKQLKILEDQIYECAGEKFNINSPKQLSEILFTKLGIPPPRKTATGYSTDADVLEKLSFKYPIAKLLQDYRTLEKLRSTYIESLPHDVNPRTNRIHCTFNQSVAATGRLSCQNPNLQNIPVRTEMGRRIREAFRPEQEGWSYLAADYSQIELRLLAHMSEDPLLIDIFQKGQDIHTYTAASMLNIPVDQVTKEQRQSAKAINFGIIYGQQAFGLSQELGIDIKEAAVFIDVYFKRYQKVKEFIERCKTISRQTGKAVTPIGRERLIPEIQSKNPQIRAAAERLAINTPVQGMQADLIKMAMLSIFEALQKEQLKGGMILQIHDELIFEIPDEEIPIFERIVRQEMQGVYPLRVPLVVDINIGKNWKEC